MRHSVIAIVATSFLWIMVAPVFASNESCAEILADSSGKYTKEQVAECKAKSNQ